MSLFGTSPEAEAPRAVANPSRSLFDDDAPAQSGARRQGGSGLFADDGSNDEEGSPWGFPTPRRQARGNPVKTLLNGSDVPESYIDAYDALLESGESARNGVALAGVRRVLAGSGISSSVQQQILKIVMSNGEDEAGLGRAEFNVVLAMIGLAQEGEEVSLDSVDERKRRLPQPRLPQLRAPRPPPQRAQSVAPPQPPPEAPREAAPPPPQPSFSYTDSDPWSTSAPKTTSMPAAQYGANGATSSAPPPSIPHRTTSTFTTTDEDTPSIPSDTIRGSEWASYNGSTTGVDYDQSGGFANPADSSIADLSASRLARSTARQNTGAEELITVNSISEKEGMFMFQHRNYEVASTRRNSKVIRRYSDFVWLLDCLHKKYPFRQLPLLPPKRMAINGTHIAADALFLEKRRRGLVRFVNALVRHPVLAIEQLVIMFLTVPTELSIWRKQANLTVLEEFTNKPLPPQLEASLSQDLPILFETVRSGVVRSAQTYITLCTLVERLIKRSEGIAADNARLSQTMQSLTELSADTYAADRNDVPMLNDGLTATARHISAHQALVLDEARTTDEIVLEDLKALRDALVSMREMFERHDRLSRNNIPSLEKRIASSQQKLATIQAKPEGTKKPGEEEKVQEAIVRDQEDIKQQHARGVFITECVRDEIGIWMGSMSRVGSWIKMWARERAKYAELVSEGWRGLGEEVEHMMGSGD